MQRRTCLPASEWMNLSQTDSVDIFDSRSPFGPEDKSSKWRPAIGQFMVERKATAISTPALLRIVSPHASAIMPVLLPNRTGGPTHLDPFHILPIDERFDISLLCAFRVYGDSVDIHMPTSLEFNRAAPRRMSHPRQLQDYRRLPHLRIVCVRHC